MKESEKVIEWIKQYFKDNGKDCNAIIGISGGCDSSVTAALLVKALGKDRVIGVLMPCGEQSDIDCAKLLVNHLGIKSYTINIKDAVNGILGNMPGEFETSVQTKTNIQPRVRMTTLYAVGQSNNGRVANTCNMSEDWVAYSTRYGDAAGDFSPISDFTVTELKQIGQALNLPSELVNKTPIDGLCGKTDEENLGFTYEVLDRYIRTGICKDQNIKNKIDEMHERNKFKLELMPSFKYDFDKDLF